MTVYEKPMDQEVEPKTPIIHLNAVITKLKCSSVLLYLLVAV